MSNYAISNDMTIEDLCSVVKVLKNQYPNYSSENIHRDLIFELVSNLPSPEDINNKAMQGDDNFFRCIKKDLAQIFAYLDRHSGFGYEFRNRHLIYKKIPPRYKTLKWRDNMKTASRIKAMIKISEVADAAGHGIISEEINNMAENFLDGKYSATEAKKIYASLKENGLHAEAQSWKGVWEGVKGVGKAGVDKAKDKASDVADKARQFGKGVKEEYLRAYVPAQIDGLLNSGSKVMTKYKAEINNLSVKYLNPIINNLLESGVPANSKIIGYFTEVSETISSINDFIDQDMLPLMGDKNYRGEISAQALHNVMNKKR